MNKTEMAQADALVSLHRLMDEAEAAHAYHSVSVFDEAIDLVRRGYSCLTAVQEKRAELGLDD